MLIELLQTSNARTSLKKQNRILKGSFLPFLLIKENKARLVKLVDTTDLKSVSLKITGSSPVTSITFRFY